ncbi:AP-3 complex subunit delta [Quillaja saponaria]|uniref:AP-3 complex subunit delta n=1 Tax=Quillaja saponaria TaxID=32244 RepID=A0AAD7M5K6_QUISA|nr:AP-3 complex subunit delta [Quillaja saponaria]
MDTLFQRTLEDLIKGIRLQLIGESAFISKAMDDIRREIKSTDPHIKSTALQKLSYLSAIYGLDMSWASFHVVEVMSSYRFAHKKIGYHAASQSFHEGTSVLLLITNQLRKDLCSTNEFEVSLALECLSRIVTVDLARDLTPEVFTLLSSSKVFVRKKAIGVVLRVFEKYPDAVRMCFKRLVENLESSDPQIAIPVIGVFCEFSSKDPRSYLPLAPEFYKILLDSRNNWVIIKILKIFAKLAPLEPRLAKRIVEPICDHMRRTDAKSLVFECIRTVVTSLSDYESAVKLAVSKARELLVDPDPNLKYLGLQALSFIARKHLWAVLENKEVVIKYLSDADPNIQLESLRLVMAMVSENNVAEISRVLVNYALKADPEFCNEILNSILSTCYRNVYEIIVDFDWYVSLLGEMTRIPNCQRGEEIENQLIDIGMRVKDVRPELVRVGRSLLIDPALLGNPHLHRILCAVAWVSGEFVEFSTNPFELVDALLQPRTSLLPPSIRTVYIQSAFKVLIFCLHSHFLENETTASSYSDTVAWGTSELATEMEWPENPNLATCKAPAFDKQEEGTPRDTNGAPTDLSEFTLKKKNFTEESIVNLLNLIELVLGPLRADHDIEILERAHNILSFAELIKGEIHDDLVQKKEILGTKDVKVSHIIKLMHDAFSKELGPVSVNAQQRVPVPEGLMLSENLDDLKTICGDVQLPSANSFSLGGLHFGVNCDVSPAELLRKEESESSNESSSMLAEHRKRHGLYYLLSEKNEIVKNDYPLANDPELHKNLKDDAEDLVKLTEQSLVLKKRPSQVKPRPVVVKLDDGDVLPISSKRPEPRDDLLSDAVRDVLLGSDNKPSSSRNTPSDMKSGERKGKGKGKFNINHPSEVEENLGDAENPDQENPNTRRSQHRGHNKERRHKSPRNTGEENNQKGKKKGSHRHSRHKTRQRAESPLNVVSQSPVIPDFLL